MIIHIDEFIEAIDRKEEPFCFHKVYYDWLWWNGIFD